MADKEKIEFWNKVGYNAAFFKDDVKITWDDPKVMNDASVLKAAQLVLQMENYLDKRGHRDLNLLSLADKEFLVENAHEKMVWFNNNVLGMGRDLKQLNSSSTTKDQKAAFLYLMDIHDKTSGGFWAAAKANAADPTNLIGLGTFGLETAGAQAAKKVGVAALRMAMKAGLKEAFVESAETAGKKLLTKEIKVAIKSETKKIVLKDVLTHAVTKGAVAGGVQGASQAAYKDVKFQNIEKGAGFIQDYSLARTIGKTTEGGLTGAAFGAIAASAGIGAGKINNKYDLTGKATILAKDAYSSAKTRITYGIEKLGTAKEATVAFTKQTAQSIGRAMDAAGGHISNFTGLEWDNDAIRAMASGGTANMQIPSFLKRKAAAGGAMPSADGLDNVIIKPYETWVHKTAKYDPFTWMNRQWAKKFNSFGGEKGSVTSQPWWKIAYNLPTRDLFDHKFINPIINHVDDQVKASELIGPIFAMRKKLEELRLKMERTSLLGERDNINNEIETTITNFAKKNKEVFAKLKKHLDPLNARMSNPDFEKGGQGTGKAGLGTQQVESITKWLNHINRLCDDVQDPNNFLNIYRANRDKYGPNDIQRTISVTGAFQHYFKLGAESDMRIKGRDFTAWSPALSNPLRSKLKIREDLLEKARKSGKITQDEFEYLQSPIYASVIKNGDDGFLAGGKNNHLTLYAENILRKQRELKDGYFNPFIRTKPIHQVAAGDAADNVENFSIILGTLFEKYQKADKNTVADQKAIAEEVLGIVRKAYDSGREGDLANGYRRAQMQQGRDGSKRPIPLEILKAIDELKISPAVNKDEHEVHYLDYIKSITDVNHSPEFFGRRHWDKMVEAVTRKAYGGRLAPGTDIMGTPGRQDYLKNPLAHLRNEIAALVTGGKIVKKEIKDDYGRPQIEYDFKWLYWDKPDEKATKFQKAWHYATAHNTLVTGVLTPITLPMKMIGGMAKHVVAPVWEHTWRLGASVGFAGLLLAGTQKLVEFKYNDGKDYKYNPGQALLKTDLYAADKIFGAPMRTTIRLAEPMVNYGVRTVFAAVNDAAIVFDLTKADPKKSLVQNYYPKIIDSHIVRANISKASLPAPWEDWKTTIPQKFGANSPTTPQTQTGQPQQPIAPKKFDPNQAPSDKNWVNPFGDQNNNPSPAPIVAPPSNNGGGSASPTQKPAPKFDPNQVPSDKDWKNPFASLSPEFRQSSNPGDNTTPVQMASMDKFDGAANKLLQLNQNKADISGVKLEKKSVNIESTPSIEA